MKITLALALGCAALGAQDFSQIMVQKVSAGHVFTEGPVWSREGFLLFSDVPGNKLLRLTPGERTAVAVEDSRGASGNAYDAQGRLYTCETGSRRVVRTDQKGQVEAIAERWQGKRLNAPNDVAVRRDGHVYFTDPAFGRQADARELDFHGVYHVPPKGEMELIAKSEGRPNGIALSGNGRLLYVTNSDEHNIRVWDLDRNGAATNGRVFASGLDGVPGGLRVDEKGNLYVACRGIAVYSPAGKLLHTIEIGETPSNCAFGDADFRTLYVTARSSVYRVRLDVKGAVQY